MQVTYAYPLVPVANFISAILALIPLPWLLQHWNTGAWTHAVWSAVSSLVVGVNTTLWADNVDIKAVTWCDISVRVFHAGSLAIVTTNFVLARRVCLIMHIQSPMSRSEKKKAFMFDLFFCVGVPLLSAGLSWFIQGHRFNIIEGSGCMFAYYPTPIYLALYMVWLLIFAILAAVYGVFIIRALMIRRNALREVVKVDPEISIEQFRRVIALGLAQCILTLPCTVYVFIFNLNGGIAPWKGLADAHYNFSAIRQIPAFLTNRRVNLSIQWNNWVTVFVAVVFFLFFGLSGAMWKDYWTAIRTFSRRLGIRLPERIVPARPKKESKDVDPPMVFHIRTTAPISTTQRQDLSYAVIGSYGNSSLQSQSSGVTNTLSDGEAITRTWPSGNPSEHDLSDLEKGDLTTSKAYPDGDSEKIRHDDSLVDTTLADSEKPADLEGGRSPNSSASER